MDNKGSPPTGERTNDYPLQTQNLKLTKFVKNGALYTAGPDNARFPIVHVYGSAYETGFAQGQLQKVYIFEFIAKTYDYLIEMV